MADTTNKLVGQNYQTPDIVAKVTGQAKYAEDFPAEGMLFTKLLLSPMPHARVRNIDASAALAMPGVHAILTEEDCPDPSGEGMATGASNIKPFMVLTNEPLYQGEPILAVVADDELTAAEAIERIQVDLEPLPFVVDPIEAMRPGSDNPREQGNVWVGNQVESIKWTDEEWREVEEGRLPFREAPDTWEVGNVEAGFEEADLIVDETLVSPSTNHDCMEPRSTMGLLAERQAVSPHVDAVDLEGRANAREIRGDPTLRSHHDRRVLRRRLWEQGQWSLIGGDSRVAGSQDGPTGHDADQPRGRAAAWHGALGAARAGEDRVPPRRPHHRDGPLHRAGQRPVPEARGWPVVRAGCDGQLHATQLPGAGSGGADQHAATCRAAGAGRRSAGAAPRASY